MTEPTTSTFIELHVPSFQKAIDFYRILGFGIVWVNNEYLVMKKENNILNFYMGSEKVYNHPYFKNFPGDSKRGYAVEIVFLEDNIVSFYASVKDKVAIVQPLIKQPWGRNDFRVEDPFGYYLRFTESYDWVNNDEKIKNTPLMMEQLKLT